MDCDLTGIKAAVKAGAATTAPADALQTPTPTSATAPGTPPARGVVNSQQLEKELFRMFANAVMYNKSTTEIVRETVEMAKDVQGMVDNFRAAEEAGTRKALAVSAAGRKLARDNDGGSVAGDHDADSLLGSSVVGDGEELGSVKGRRGRKKKTAAPGTPTAADGPST